jgi:hypothetical protein
VARYKIRPKEELYDLDADPHEEHNLAEDSRQAERLGAMRDKLATWRKSQGDTGRVFGEPLLAGEEATPLHPAAAKTKKQ